MDKELLEAIRQIVREEVQASEARTASSIAETRETLREEMRELVHASDAKTAEKIKESEARIMSKVDERFKDVQNVVFELSETVGNKIDKLQKETDDMKGITKDNMYDIAVMKRKNA